jgi:hypothetical protein
VAKLAKEVASKEAEVEAARGESMLLYTKHDASKDGLAVPTSQSDSSAMRALIVRFLRRGSSRVSLTFRFLIPCGN